jgi:tRNA(Ile2) C34 agmatinyltransferase TiaS
MPDRPVPPKGFRIVEECEPCPKCGSKVSAKIQQQKRCSQCGHQWPPVKREPLGPTRRDILNGTAYFQHTQIVRSR